MKRSPKARRRKDQNTKESKDGCRRRGGAVPGRVPEWSKAQSMLLARGPESRSRAPVHNARGMRGGEKTFGGIPSEDQTTREETAGAKSPTTPGRAAVEKIRIEQLSE